MIVIKKGPKTPPVQVQASRLKRHNYPALMRKSSSPSGGPLIKLVAGWRFKFDDDYRKEFDEGFTPLVPVFFFAKAVKP